MNDATGNTIVLLSVVAFIAFIGFIVKRRYFNGARHAPPPVVHNPNPHVPHPPASAPPAGGPIHTPHPPAAAVHAPAAHPAPDPHAAHAAHGSGIWQWIKDRLWLVIPWILVVGLVIAVLFLYSSKDANGPSMPNLSSILGEGSSIGEYVFPGLLILVGLILLLWPDKAGSEKKGH